MSTSTQRLRAVREAHGLSLKDVSIKAGVDKGQLSKIERGIQRPTVETLARICRAIELTDQAVTIERLWP